MADEQDAASKTEDASPKRLADARQKGDVPKSSDLAQAFAFAGACGALLMSGSLLAHNLADALLPFIAHPDSMNLEGAAGVNVGWRAMQAALPPVAAVMGAAMLAGVGGNIVQTGVIFTTAKLAPDLSKLNPLEGWKKLFNPDGAANFVRSVLKLVLVAAVAWWVLQPHMKEFPGLIGVGPIGMLTYMISVGRDLLFAVMGLLALGGVIDFLWQRHRFMERMKMTKEEVKDDFKQAEGDPHVKGRQRSIRLTRARQRMIQKVPTATVVVVNPTHFAVALRYVQGETAAPECVAKGVDAVALRIREIAEEAGVPLVEDPPLARALYANVEIDQTIPTQHYEAVAKIIGFILSAKRKPRARGL